jgi:hypothetical protein
MRIGFGGDMAQIDRSAAELSFLSSFLSGEAKTGRFEAMIVLLGVLAISVGVVLAGYMPAAIDRVAAP